MMEEMHGTKDEAKIAKINALSAEVFEDTKDVKRIQKGLSQVKSLDSQMEYSLKEIYWIQKLNTCNFQHNGDDYFIHKLKDKKMRLGFKYCFEIKRKKIVIVRKKSSNLEFLKKFRDEWIKDNQQIFYL